MGFRGVTEFDSLQSGFISHHASDYQTLRMVAEFARHEERKRWD